MVLCGQKQCGAMERKHRRSALQHLQGAARPGSHFVHGRWSTPQPQIPHRRLGQTAGVFKETVGTAGTKRPVSKLQRGRRFPVERRGQQRGQCCASAQSTEPYIGSGNLPDHLYARWSQIQGQRTERSLPKVPQSGT
ncbi:hypothetical protein RvY_12388 [Ramazzottius varieornatus]|uniref:Uncharacterized protein n=1 Tax=Ramazzottius varieornatus TaxID=947166 RepID=A0A1D1VPT0_RAMVA|nr:hypothetical protein RvY_12388 [Ramazzottius varieornatus]